jgi:hypothetical protein
MAFGHAAAGPAGRKKRDTTALRGLGFRKNQSAGRRLGRARRPRSPRPTLESKGAAVNRAEGFGLVGEECGTLLPQGETATGIAPSERAR